MDKLKNHYDRIRIPQNLDKIYKEECIYSFDSPDINTGLYVCLNSFLALGRDFVEDYSKRTNNFVFLHRKRTKTEIVVDKECEPDKKIARLAIGVEGGFNVDAGNKKYEYNTTSSIVILPEFDTIPLPNDDLPQLVIECISAIEKAEDAVVAADNAATAGSWDGVELQVSSHAENLVQLNNGVKVSPRGWQCSKCDLKENLWMNLTDGTILCGRRQLDGSGGNNHALEHYNETHYPLAVKLGTITPEGKADIYSYSEDDMVLDPHLTKHLAHFGINVSSMEKTDKTMQELEIDINKRGWEYSRLTESGQKLVPMFGPGYTGLRNLGNSCYVNSVVQLLLTVPSFVKRYYEAAPQLLSALSPGSVTEDFDAQFAKLAVGLLSGRYSAAPENFDPNSDEEVDVDTVQPGIAPTLFRSLVGKGHQEFSGKRQQDAVEYLEYLLSLVERSARKAGVPDPGLIFRLGVEDKFVCCNTGEVRYVERNDLYIPLPVPLDAATNIAQVEDYKQRKAEAEKNGERFLEDAVRYVVPFEECLSRLVTPEAIETQSAGKMRFLTRTTMLLSFPDYLFVQLVKFGLTDTWEPVKYDVSVPMPDVLDIELMRAPPHPEGEKLLSDDSATKSSVAPTVDEKVVSQLCEMGFPDSAVRKAIQLTGNCGSEAAMGWIVEHMEDTDFDEPLTVNASCKDSSFTANPEFLVMLESMGFTQAQASLALKETQNNVERAADWLFSHQSELGTLLADDISRASSASISKPVLSNGVPRYELVGFISHMGTSIHVGHYVCHIKKDGQWTIFNDNKVSKSVDPPKDLGYLYLYKRASS